MQPTRTLGQAVTDESDHQQILLEHLMLTLPKHLKPTALNPDSK